MVSIFFCFTQLLRQRSIVGCFTLVEHVCIIRNVEIISKGTHHTRDIYIYLKTHRLSSKGIARALLFVARCIVSMFELKFMHVIRHSVVYTLFEFKYRANLAFVKCFTLQ